MVLTSRPTSPRARSGWRTARRGTALTIALVFITAVLARNVLLEWVIQPAIEEATGGRCTLVDARWSGVHEVSFDSITLHVNGWDGDSAEVIHLTGCRVSFSLSGLFAGRLDLERISIDTATVRIAERHDAPYTINLAAFAPPPEGEPADDVITIGTLDIAALTFDVGTDTDGVFESVSTETFDLNVAPIGDDGLHAFRLRQPNDDTDDSTEFKGWWNPTNEAFAVEVDHLDLDSGSPLAMLASIRASCEGMNLTGHVAHASLAWKVGERPHATLEIDALGLTLPKELGLDDEWTRLRNGQLDSTPPPPPRMELRHGEIEMDDDMIIMRKFIGELLPSDGNGDVAPIKIRFDAKATLTATPEWADVKAWSEELLATAPFELELTISEFVHAPPQQAGDSIADLPRPIANVLARLQARKWNLAAIVRADRESTSAEVFLAGGEGAYIGFDYPLENVSGRIIATRDEIHIDSMRGLTPHGLELFFDGEITGTGKDAAVELHIRGNDIPIDSTLLDALPGPTRHAVGQLFDTLATERLAAAGLLVNDATVADARARATMIREMNNAAELEGNVQTIERFALEHRRMDAIVDAGAFALGGSADIDFRVHRLQGPSMPVVVEGTLDLKQVGVVFDGFPYAVIATDGQLRVGPDVIEVTPPGITITTPAGGRGRITGHVDLIDDGSGGRTAHPRIDIIITNDVLTPALFAAVPPEGNGAHTATAIDGWPGERYADAVIPMQELGLGGPLDCHATIQTRHDGAIEVRAVLTLKNGTLNPPQDRERVTEAGKAWPRGLSLRGCEATLLIEPEAIELRSFSGHRGEGTVHAEGAFDRLTNNASGRVTLRSFAIEPYILELVPENAQAAAHELHARWRPKGSFDGVLVWEHTPATDVALFTITPQTLTITSHDNSQTLVRHGGSVGFQDGMITIDALDLRDESTASRFEVDGSMGWEDSTATHAFEFALFDVHASAPIITEALRLAAGDAVESVWHERAPQGVFDATIEIEHSSNGTNAHADVIVDSMTLLATPGDPLSRGGGVFDPPGHIFYDNGDLIIEPLFIRGDGDTVLELSGRALNLDGSGSTRLDFDYSLAGSSSLIPEIGFLPPPYNEIINDDALHTGVFHARGDAHLELTPDNEDVAAFESIFQLSFVDGVFDIGGVRLHDIAGTTEHTLLFEDDVVRELSGTSDFPQVRIEDRTLRNLHVETSLTLASSGANVIDFHLTKGTLYDGPVRGHLHLDPEHDWFRASFQGVDVALDGLANPEKPGSPPTSGRIDASIAAEGTISDPDSWVGRGELALLDGDIAGNNSALALLRAGQLMPPTAQGFDEASVSFLIDGSEALLSRILLDSPTLQLSGSGRLRLSDFSIAARLLPKGRLGALSDLVSAVTGTVYALDIQGPLWDPSTSLTPLPMMVQPPAINLQPPSPETPSE